MSIGTIGKYERLDVLGHGTSGVVYLAWDNLLRRQVALKEIRCAGPEMNRVLQEAQVLARLRHPNIIEVHGVEQQEGTVLIDMELVRGKNLADLLKTRDGRPLPLSEALAITRAVLDALDYAHTRRIIHRDVKPGNLLIAPDDQPGGPPNGQHVKLTDFGLAEALGSGSVAGGGGTYPYMAPEDFAEQEASDYRSDLWAVGVMLYEMLAGHRPFQVPVGRARDPFSWKRVIEEHEPPPLHQSNPEVSPDLDALLQTALAKRKEERFATAQAFRRALNFAAPNSASQPGADRGFFAPLVAEENGSRTFTFARGTVRVVDLDGFREQAQIHFEEARRALLSGQLERWLRRIGEVYIADLARELSQREGADGALLLREFLERSAPDEAPQDLSREAVKHDLEDATVARTVGLPLGRAVSRTVRGGVAAVFPAEKFAVPSSEQLSAPPTPEGMTLALAERFRWWFWPVYLLCLGPAVASSLQGNAFGGGAIRLFSAWAFTGFGFAMLFFVGVGAQVPRGWRVATIVPVALGLTAGFALLSSVAAPKIAAGHDPVPILAVGLAPLALLLMQAATALRLWRLWLALTLAVAAGGILLFLPVLLR